MLEQANLICSVSTLTGVAGSLAVAMGALGLHYGPLVGVPAGLVEAITPFAYVHFKRKARHEKFLKQLPGAFELMARVLRGGHSVPQALQAVAD